MAWIAWIEINLVIGALEIKVGELQEQDCFQFIPNFITQDSSGNGVYAVQISVLRLNKEEVKGMIINIVTQEMNQHPETRYFTFSLICLQITEILDARILFDLSQNYEASRQKKVERQNLEITSVVALRISSQYSSGGSAFFKVQWDLSKTKLFSGNLSCWLRHTALSILNTLD